MGEGRAMRLQPKPTRNSRRARKTFLTTASSAIRYTIYAMVFAGFIAAATDLQFDLIGCELQTQTQHILASSKTHSPQTDRRVHLWQMRVSFARSERELKLQDKARLTETSFVRAHCCTHRHARKTRLTAAYQVLSTVMLQGDSGINKNALMYYNALFSLPFVMLYFLAIRPSEIAEINDAL